MNIVHWHIGEKAQYSVNKGMVKISSCCRVRILRQSQIFLYLRYNEKYGSEILAKKINSSVSLFISIFQKDNFKLKVSKSSHSHYAPISFYRELLFLVIMPMFPWSRFHLF